ncbi:MAG: hypothetical protein MN733_01375, partial [Nitrososphaera sp.]|nr:hypothetical protein [Nitrososphaera sp.]
EATPQPIDREDGDIDSHGPKNASARKEPANGAQPVSIATARSGERTEGVEAVSLFLYTPSNTTQQIAFDIVNGQAQNRFIALRDLIIRLLLDGRAGIAFHLARCMEAKYNELHPILPSWLIRAAVLSQYVHYPTGELARILKDDFGKFNNDVFTSGDGDWNDGIFLLLAAATLRPALLAPNTGASAILHSLRAREGFSRFHDWCQIVAKYGDNHRPLDPKALKAVKDQAGWQTDLDSLQKEVEVWCTQAPRMTMVYAPATKVWRKWQEPTGFIQSLLRPIRHNDVGRLASLKQEIERISDDAEIRREIERTNFQGLHRRRSDEIIAKALGQILRHVREAATYARRWVDLQESRPDQPRGYLQDQAERIRQPIRNQYKNILDEFDSYQPSSLIATCGRICCRKAVQNISRLFDPEDPLQNEEPKPTHLLHPELLKVTALDLDDKWEPQSQKTDEVENAITSFLIKDKIDWYRAFQSQSDKRDHEATDRIIEYLSGNPDKSINLDDLEHSRNKGIQECRDALERDAEETQKKIETAVAFGLLRDTERMNHVALIESIVKAIPETLRFHDKHDQLRSIILTLEEKRKAEVDSVRARLDSIGLTSDNGVFIRISQALDRGDVLTANEYIDMTRAGEKLPESGDHLDAFTDFFPDKARIIGEFLEK